MLDVRVTVRLKSNKESYDCLKCTFVKSSRDTDRLRKRVYEESNTFRLCRDQNLDRDPSYRSGLWITHTPCTLIT